MKILLVNRYHYPVGGTETYLLRARPDAAGGGAGGLPLLGGGPAKPALRRGGILWRGRSTPKSARSTRRGCSGTGRAARKLDALLAAGAARMSRI